jgi:hypothetical protein
MTTTGDSRPNFFIILGLPPEDPWDEARYAQALSEKRNLWARQAGGDKKQKAAIDAQRNLLLCREIERVMHDPRSRGTERQTAIWERQDASHRRHRLVADQVADMLEKGYLLDDEYEWLSREEAILADSTLRQRVADAERRPRARGDGHEQWLDQAMEQDLRKYLNVIGQPDLYAVLRMADPEAGQATPADRLLAAADALHQGAADQGSPEAEAMRILSGIARQVLGSPDLKQRHDAAVQFRSLDPLLDRYEASLEIARAISSRQFEKFLREAAARGIDIGVARDDLIARFGKRGWSVDMPAAAFEARLRAEILCPGCSRLNDPESGHCGHCGRALHRPCPGCGAAIPGTAHACSACGFPVGERDYVAYLVEQAAACLARRDVSGADEHAAEAAQLWPVPAGRSDDLSDRIRAERAKIADLRAAQRELIRQVDPLMDARKYQTAARLLREAVVTHPGLAGHLEECEDAIRVSARCLSDARAPGLPGEQRAERYSEALRACADNDEARSELALLSLSPVIPGPVSAERQQPRMSIHEVELDFPPPERGEAVIICARLGDQSPQAGAEFPASELGRYRTISRGTRDFFFSEEEWLRCYTLVLVLHGRCYMGGTRRYARGPEVAGLRTEHTGTSVLVTWTWPAEVPNGTEVSEALISWHDNAEIGDPVNAPALQYVPREPGMATGRYEIPAAGRLFVKVAVVVRHQDTAYISSGVRADARRQPLTLKYEVRSGRGHRGKLISGKLMISVDGGRLDQLPALSLRGRPDSRPASLNGDEEITLIPAGLAAGEIPVKLENPSGHRIEPRSCRLFAADSTGAPTVRIIDPA